MAHYVVGDIQGCLPALQCLLEKINFQPQHDTLICAGDLVNRGPDSLGTLRFLHQMEGSVKAVLGNHDLHLLAIYYGIRSAKKHSSIANILEAEDAPTLIKWLREFPLLLHLEEFNAVVSHAGIPPFWNLQEAKSHAEEVNRFVRGEHIAEYLEAMYGDDPDLWHEDMHDALLRSRVITNYFTRMRFCSKQGHLDLENKGAPSLEKDGKYKKNGRKYGPWFNFKRQFSEDIYFGHWASLLGKSPHKKGIYALDTGCVWGYQLTAIRLEDKQLFSCDCHH